MYALTDKERFTFGGIQMLQDEKARWGSIERLQGFTVDTSPQVLQKLASAGKVEFRVNTTEFTLKPEHQEALLALLERVQAERGKLSK